MWLRSKEFKEKLGLSNQALYERRKRGTLKFKKINNVYFYWIEEEIHNDTEKQNAIYCRVSNTKQKDDLERQNAIYCRVSNTKQKDDLERQEKLLKEYAISNGYKIEYVFKDITSGMNEDRNDLNKMIKLVMEHKIDKIFISYKDRLTRFGFNYFEYIFKLFDTEIVTVNLTKEEDFQTELTQDLISIIHHFSMKMYSNRRKQLKQLKRDLENKN